MLRIGTFNLLHGMPVRGEPASDGGLRTAAAALDVDVLGLQEVDRAQGRSGGADQAAVVAEELGARDWRFVPSLLGTPSTRPTWTPATGDGSTTPEGPSYGVALLSRRPVRSWHVLRFPAARVGAPLIVSAGSRSRLMRVPDEPRVAIAAVIDTAGGPVTVATAHLSFVPGVNALQLRRLVRWLDTLPGPRLLAGDLNLPGSLPRRLTGWAQLARVASWPAYRPRVQFDHVLADGAGEHLVRDVTAVTLPVSDHCAVVVALDALGPLRQAER